MKVVEAQYLKIGAYLKMQVLMSKNTFTLEGILKRIDLNPDPHIEIEVTEYHNPLYPKDEAYVVGHVQPVFLRKIRRCSVGASIVDVASLEENKK